MKIEVFDNQVPFAVREKALDYCSRANFTLGWTDRPVIKGLFTDSERHLIVKDFNFHK